MIIRRLPILVALLVVGPSIGSCDYLYYLGCHQTPSPGEVPVVMQDGFTAEFEVRPEKAKSYPASLRFRRPDLAQRSLDTDLPEAVMSVKVAIVDAQGTVRFEKEFVTGGQSSFSAADRYWNSVLLPLTTELQTVQITILRVEPNLSGLPAVFEVAGGYPKSCD